MTTENTPNTDTSTSTEHLSPALAGLVAQILMPKQYSKFVSVAMLGVNEQCRSTVRHIDK